MRSEETTNSTGLILKCVLVFLISTFASLVGGQTLQILGSFNFTNGAGPLAGLTQGRDGNLYGTTQNGGITNSTFPYGIGTVFKLTTNGTLATLASFSASNGANPGAGLVQASDGNFYGTTAKGGANGNGTAFKVTTSGLLTPLAGFNLTNGANPSAGLTLGSDGNFYGTTQDGGITNSTIPGGMGTVFKMATNGTLATLVVFAFTNGAGPVVGLTQGADGNFYGTTASGGFTNPTYTYGMGTVFRLTTNGTLTTLVAFSDTNGATPSAELTLGKDGSFYGTTGYGGSGDSGTVFNMTASGILTTVAAFNSTNGAFPHGGLMLGADGNFYGTTYQGGLANSAFPTGMGTLFQVTTNGTLTTLLTFAYTNGAWPAAGLTLVDDGKFYGTTFEGGITNSTFPTGMGTVFRLLLLPVITFQPQNQTNDAGATVTFLVNATDPNPLTYQWKRNGTNLIDGGNISGATTNTLTITDISDGDVAGYSVLVSNSYGTVSSSLAALTVIDPPTITVQPSNVLVLPGTNATFSVSLTGTAPFRYQWRLNGTNLINATNAVYEISLVTTNKAGNYSAVITNAAGAVTTSNAALTVVVSPRSQTNYASSTATFTATAFSPESLNYQWQKNGTNLEEGGRLSGATKGTLIIAGILDTDAGSYSAVVSDAYGSVTTSNAVLTVNDSLVIASQPQSQTAGLGSNVTFNVTVYGVAPFIFQWYFNGTPLGSPATGTNFASYTLTNVGTNQAGKYGVLVVNGAGSLMSSNAVLTVKAFPPSIGLQPSSQRVMIGSGVAFVVSVNGTPPFHYQWQFKGSNLLDATNAAYAIQAVGTTNNGNYSVVVTNAMGSVTSSNALLTVIVPPTLGLQLGAGYPLLNLDGMLSNNFTVQYSTNLAVTNWIDLLLLTNLQSSPYLFLDPSGVGQPARFYRTFMQ